MRENTARKRACVVTVTSAIFSGIFLSPIEPVRVFLVATAHKGYQHCLSCSGVSVYYYQF